MIHNIIKRYQFILPLIFILALSYWRYTYIINPNYNGEPILLDYRLYIGSLGANSLVNIRSIIIYWALFFIGNITLFRLLFFSKEKVKTVVFFYLLITFFSVSLILVDRFMIPSEALFNLGATMKNFLLGPIFTAMSYLIIEYLQWFVRSN